MKWTYIYTLCLAPRCSWTPLWSPGSATVSSLCKLLVPEFSGWIYFATSFGAQLMGKCKGSGKLSSMMGIDESVCVYQVGLLLVPIVSVWDCTIRKRRYSFKPDWV